jgi:uncharacterized protein HemY
MFGFDLKKLLAWFPTTGTRPKKRRKKRKKARKTPVPAETPPATPAPAAPVETPPATPAPAAPVAPPASSTAPENPNAPIPAFLGFAHYIRVGESGWSLRPRWRAIAPALAAIALIIYLAAVFYQYYRDRYFYDCETTSLRDTFLRVIPNRIPRTDIVFLPPFINDVIVAARARQTANMAEKLFANPRNVWDILWAANAMPNNIEAQFQAAYYLASPDWLDRLNNAFAVLDNALPRIIRSPDRESIRRDLTRYIKFCSEYDQDQRIVTAAENYLDDPQLPEDARGALATAYAEAIFLRGDLAKSRQILERYKIADSLSGFILSTRIIWENGEHDRAIALIKKRADRGGEGRERLLYALAKFYWEEKDIKKAAETVAQVIAHSPDDFRPRVYLYSLIRGPEHRAQRLELADKIIADFRTNESAMLALGSSAADNGDFDIQKRVTALAFEQRFPRIANFRLLSIETLVAQRRYDDAVEQISDILLKQPSWLRTQNMQEQFESLRMLAYFSKQEDAAMGVITFERLLKKRMSVQMCVAIARRLVGLDRHHEALLLLQNAYKQNPFNQGVLLELVKLDLKDPDAPALAEHVDRLTEARRPPRYVLQDAYERLGSDRYLFVPRRDKIMAKLDTMLTSRTLPLSNTEREWLGENPAGDKTPAVKPKI